MAAFNSLQREYKGMFSDPRAMYGDESAQLDDVDRQNAFKGEQAVLDKRKAAQKMLGEQQTGETNKRLFGSYMAGELNRPKWTAEITGAEKPTSADWWGANDRQANAASSSDYDPRSVGTHLMGSGNNFDDQSPYGKLAGLASNRTPQPGVSTPPAASGGGEVTMSPGGNYSRGPAMDEMGIEALKQARIKTTAMEQQIPSAALERERNATNFDIGTGQTARAARYAGDITRDETTRNRRQQAIDTYDRDIYRAETSKPEFDATIQGNEIIRRLNAKSAADLAALRLRGDTAVDVQELKSGSADAKTFMDALTKAGAMPGFSEEDKTNRAIAIAMAVDAARKRGINLGATPEGQKIIQSLVGGAPSQTGTGNLGYNAQQNSVR